MVVGETAYVGLDDGRVVGVDVRRGVEVWEDRTGPGNIGPLAASGGTLVASKRGRRGGLIAWAQAGWFLTAQRQYLFTLAHQTVSPGILISLRNPWGSLWGGGCREKG